ncbi:MAG TPA: cytochrome c [Pyrinomonadaceae bacterium]|nr:cytochrome c [Pyrinomonadaceae bacterium]
MRKSILPLLTFSLLLAASILFVTHLEVSVKSSAQNQNDSKTTNKNSNSNDSRSIMSQPSGGGGGAQQDFSKNTWELPADADKTKNPVSATPESIAKGKELYLDRNKGNCIFCHGETGAGNEANLARLRRKPADLTNKERMTAMTDGELFWKITKGITGIMPAGEKKMPQDEERWHVVNYIRTLPKT